MIFPFSRQIHDEMVGPRSTGCRICVGRRIRCDGARPHCRRCQLAGYQCVGYTPPIKFLPPVTPRGDVPADRTSSGAFLSKSTAQSAARRQRSSSAGSEIAVSRDGVLTLNMPGLNPMPELTLRPLIYTDDAYCVFFLDRYFCFANWNADLESNKIWFWRVLHSPSKYPVSNAACRALATSFFARAQRIDDLAHYTHELHGLALKRLAARVQNGIVNFDVLAANTLLLLYEVCSPTSRNAWIKHTKAMHSLWQRLGPEFFRHLPARSILMMNRYAIINTAIVARQRCFLGEKPWLNILSCDDREGELTIKLGDIAVQVPKVFEGIKALEHLPNPGHASSRAHELFGELLLHLQDLKSWWYQWSSEPKRLPVRVLMADSNEATLPAPPSSPVGQPLTFCNLETAGNWIRYHSHIILALRWMRRLLDLRIPGTVRTGRSEQHSSLKFSTRDSMTDFRIRDDEMQDHALAICEGLHFFTSPRYRHTGAIFIGLSVRAAYQTLPRNSPCSLWIESLTVFMSTHSGFEAPIHMLTGVEVND